MLLPLPSLLPRLAARAAAAGVALFTASLSLLPCPAAAQTDLVVPLPNATPLTLVPPAFPPNSSASAPGIEVVLVGTVLTNGEFKPVSITAGEGQQPFVDAVAEVLKWWRFVPAIDGVACAPLAAQTELSVWFEGSTAAPRVYVSFPKGGPGAPDPADGRNVLPEYVVRYPKLYFPLELEQKGIEGQVRVLYRVGIDGVVESATVRSSTPYGAFDEIVLPSARRTQLKWTSAAPAAALCLEREFFFCMSRPQDAKIPFHGCRNKKAR